jgi:predicted extracellular nuclease
MKKIYLLLAVLLSFTGYSQSYNVTFSVDMNEYTGTYTNVYVSGSLNSWSGNSNQLSDADGDGVYDGVISLAAGNYEFKFTLDNWSGQESLDATLDSACTLTTGIYTNRYISIGAADTTLPTVCWESCMQCMGYQATSCGDLFFSEYAEGSSNHKYIEIYNPTANAISLSGYTVYASGNGGSWTNSFTSNATIASGDVYFIANSSLDSATQSMADTSLSYPSIVHFNGDDALILVNGTDTIDVIGTPGVDPGSSWTVGTGSTANHTLVRKATVDMGSTDWTTGAAEWDVYAQNTWSYAGAHSSNCIVTPKNVTFQVDMNNVTASYTNVYVSGTVNGWSGNSNQLTDPDGDGVYTGTLSLMPGSYEYKFTYDNWAGQESLDPTLDSACTLTTGIYTNRYATFGNADTTLPVVCWESCASCPVQSDFVVTFMVNTANITVGTNGLYLGGGVIGGANAVQLSDPDGDGIYVGTDTLNGSNGGNFIFLNSPANAWDWNTKENLTGLSCADPNNYNDRILPTFTQDTTLMFCFGTCSTDTSCTVTTTNPDVTFRVDMNNVSASFTNVYVSGTLNGWSGNSNQLTDPDGDGVYEGDISLAAGNYEFKFTYDNWTGQENLDPATADSVCTLTTGIYTNRYITIGSSDTTLPVYCWEECVSCASNYTPVACGDLFFSEYAEGSSNHKYIEIYNPTANPISLSGYTVYASGNGGSWTNSFTSNATITSGDVYFIANSSLDSATQSMADTSLSYPSIVHFNGDDALILVNGTDTIDVIGTPGVDPGSSWTVGTGSTQNHTLVRKATVDMGSTDWTTGAAEWDVYASNTWSYADAHTSNCVTVSAGCDELFFSEYSEGSSNHKYFEIYNPTASSVSLSGYTVYLSGNGGSFTNSYSPSGSLASGDVYVISTNQADASILAEADTAMAFPSVAHFNGDDALILVNGTDTIDVIGVPGVDPGSSWTVDTGSTANHTLIRKATVSAGQTDWTVGATEWNVHPQNTWSYVGAHSSNCISTPTGPSFPDVVAINTFNSMDANGVADSIGAMKWVKVIVTSIDFDGNAGYSFYAEDATDGINIWNFADKSGYTMPMMGDSLYIHGEVAQYRGLTELEPDSIYLVNQNNTLPAASIETALDETTESELIQLIGMTVVDPTQWPASGSSANVDITNGTDTMTMRIDSDTDIDGSTAPSGMFDVTGLGSQFDFSSPYDEGYQIFPRMLTDIFEYPTIPLYAISDVTGIDADGVADSLGVLCKVVGTVMGVDLQGSATAIQFTIHDGVDGIGVYSSAPAAQSYSVMEGDQVRLIGTIGQFNGLTQMYPDSITFISSNNTLPTPTVVTQLGENTESELVTFTSATLVDPSQWTGSGSGFNVDITNGTDTIAMRIDNDVDLYSQAAPTGAFDVTGIGGQYDYSSPHTSGYQLLPRYQADIVPAAAVYVPKIVVSEIMPGSNASTWNADWFEIYNYGDTAVDLAGMSWDDESGISGTSTFPSVTVAPGEAVVVWDDVSANEDSLLVSWKLYPGSVQVISTDELTGSFPSLSQNGDGVYLFDAAGIELTKSEYTSGTAGYSIEFDTTGASLGDAVDGVNGAYTSLNGDVGSPGNLTPNTGAGEFTLNGRIYPNPNTGQFKIEMDRTDNYTVEVMDVRGAVLSRMAVDGNTISVDVNVSAGMYLVRVSSIRGTVTQRVQVL